MSTRVWGITLLASWMGQTTETLRSTIVQYQQDAKHGTDQWGKTAFQGVPSEDLDKEVFYVGTVQPVLHYCMGGITIDTEGSVLNEKGETIPGLHAVGEVTGGVHGNNRLGGNSLLECTVFGTIVGKKLTLQTLSSESLSSSTALVNAENGKEPHREVTMTELQQHNSPRDCWVAIDGIVYDLTAFADEHPGGANSIHALAGKDGSTAFLSVHSRGLLNGIADKRIGRFVSTGSTN